MKKNLRIGFLVSDLGDSFVQDLVKGAHAGAEEIGADLVVMPGHYLVSNNFDVLFVCFGEISNFDKEQKIVEIITKMGATPVITVASKYPGLPGICFEKRDGLYEGISSLIKQYNRKKIGFVSGSASDAEARECLQVYREALMDNGIVFDSAFVAYEEAEDAKGSGLEKLLEADGSLDAVVFADDEMAVEGYDVLKKHKIQVGEDILVMGFGDVPCALSVQPNLTTVRADAVEMGYIAIKNSMELANGLIDFVSVETRFIPRESFGEYEQDFGDLETNWNEFAEHELVDRIMPDICKVLFEGCHNSQMIEKHSKAVRDFVSYISAMIYEKSVNIMNYHVLEQKLKNWLLTADKLPLRRMEYILEYLSDVIVKAAPDDASKTAYTDMMKNVYKEVYCMTEHLSTMELHSSVQITNQLVQITNAVLCAEKTDENIYEVLLDKMRALPLKEFYLCVYPEAGKPSNKCLLKCGYDENNSYCPKEEEQEILLNEIFECAHIQKEVRHTLIVEKLSVGKEQYGVLISSMDEKYYTYLAAIALQMAGAIKNIVTLQQNAVMAKRLQDNMRQMRESTHMLDEISKRDELTRLYNRRGFMAAATEELNDPANRDRKAVIVCADVDDLKKINDEFGREEGDAALQKAANILKESFRNTDIVGKYGQDVFVAFALVDQPKYVQKLRETIDLVTANENEISGKPYRVSISIGICEFNCEEGISISDMMDTADGDLYYQKRSQGAEIEI